MNTKKKDDTESSSKTYQERLDPELKLSKSLQGMEVLASKPFSWILKMMAADKSVIDKLPKEVQAFKKQYEKLMKDAEHIANQLSPLGWIMFGAAHQENYKKAADLVQENKIEDAEEFLVTHWNENTLLKMSRYQVISLYSQAGMYELGEMRSRLIAKAVSLHEKEEYAGSIPIILAQMEGIIIDMTGDKQKLFYSPKNPEHLEDTVTLPGHHLGLKTLSKIMSGSMNGTKSTGKLLRHGIMHGRELGYDTKLNSTKVLVALLAVIEFSHPLAAALNKNKTQ